MDMAFCVASESTSDKRQVGAIAVRDNNVLGIGFNGTPNSWYTNACELVENETSDHVIHAEMNMIAKMAKSTNSSGGSTVYVTTAPCLNCAKIMHQTGVTRVVYATHYKNNDGPNFLNAVGVDCQPAK